MKSYRALLAEHTALTKQIDAAKALERSGAIEKVRAVIAEFAIKPHEAFPRSAKRRKVVRYRDPSTGATWSGRGRPPAWIEGKDRSQFEVIPTAARP
ncbi:MULTISPECIES: H-NS family nucleoid-associated regulatory protein [Burkholderia]|uniref:DNA-binding protein H-NS n=1 Tax=Burkholderia pyrrocinia TaxID=60550 RepID=A0A318I4C6_BURPY|nr:MULTISPECIES: H-NS histone family protein [Burkholderia]PXX25827.1 DNA-binding protein H-NS [Burkholderia pyrrocinia]SFW83669.1 DNA-binding protein H-NS [Burkholderia sp. NFACC33-1]SFY44787.1 DNA-binding protein H-NS [Burkholderia sp. NFPP32]